MWAHLIRLEVQIGVQKFWPPKHPSRIWISFGQTISSRTILYKPLVIATMTHFWFLEHNSLNDIAMCVSFGTSEAVKEHLTSGEGFINLMIIDEYLDNLLERKHFGHFFERHFWLALDFGLDRIWKKKMSESYTTSPDPSAGRCRREKVERSWRDSRERPTALWPLRTTRAEKWRLAK